MVSLPMAPGGCAWTSPQVHLKPTLSVMPAASAKGRPVFVSVEDDCAAQIVGPSPCQDSFFDNCNSAVAHTHTGSTVVVGAPTGSARVLTPDLHGNVPELNHCP